MRWIEVRRHIPKALTILRFDNLSSREPATFIAFYLLAGDQPLIQSLP